MKGTGKTTGDELKKPYGNMFAVIRSLYEILDQQETLAEKVVTIRDIMARAKSESELYKSEAILGEFYDEYVAIINHALQHYENVWDLERGNGTGISVESAAYKRVEEFRNKQTVFVGSLSDFVYLFDQLAVNGYLIAAELDEALAENFMVAKDKGSKPRKVTAKLIDGRRRNMKYKSKGNMPKATPAMVQIASQIIEGMSSKQAK